MWLFYFIKKSLILILKLYLLENYLMVYPLKLKCKTYIELTVT